jgi:hypothetical protein
MNDNGSGQLGGNMISKHLRLLSRVLGHAHRSKLTVITDDDILKALAADKERRALLPTEEHNKLIASAAKAYAELNAAGSSNLKG